MMMQSGLLLLISLVVMISFLMLMQTRLINLVKWLIVQNVALTLYILGKAVVYPSTELYLSLIITAIFKVILLPWLLWKLVDYLKLQQRIDPLLNKATLQIIGIFLVILVLVLSHQMEAVIGRPEITGFSLSLANSLMALLLIIFRRKAISQVIGLLVMENSIFLLSVTLTSGFPWLIELGMGFDVLIAFMIFGLFLFRIRTMYGSLQMHHLEKLKERI